jgi:hypothetical protein
VLVWMLHNIDAGFEEKNKRRFNDNHKKTHQLIVQHHS